MQSFWVNVVQFFCRLFLMVLSFSECQGWKKLLVNRVAFWTISETYFVIMHERGQWWIHFQTTSLSINRSQTRHLVHGQTLIVKPTATVVINFIETARLNYFYIDTLNSPVTHLTTHAELHHFHTRQLAPSVFECCKIQIKRFSTKHPWRIGEATENNIGSHSSQLIWPWLQS